MTANTKEPLVVGVPAITPVAAFSARPGGRVPAATTHVCVPAGVAVRVAV
jgi:hypothetical protein